MLAVLTLAASAACSVPSITLADAERLVLATPDIRAAIAERHARPFFEVAQRRPEGWYFVVKASNPCAGFGPCSTLLGHYVVNRRDAVIENLDVGGDGRVVSSASIRRRQRTLLRNSC